MKAIYMFEYRQRVKTNHDVHRIFLKLKEKTSDTLVDVVNEKAKITKKAVTKVLESYRNLNVQARYNAFTNGFTVSATDRQVMLLLNHSALAVADRLFNEARIRDSYFKDMIESEQPTKEREEQLKERIRYSSVDYDQ